MPCCLHQAAGAAPLPTALLPTTSSSSTTAAACASPSRLLRHARTHQRPQRLAAAVLPLYLQVEDGAAPGGAPQPAHHLAEPFRLKGQQLLLPARSRKHNPRDFAFLQSDAQQWQQRQQRQA